MAFFAFIRKELRQKSRLFMPIRVTHGIKWPKGDNCHFWFTSQTEFSAQCFSEPGIL